MERLSLFHPPVLLLLLEFLPAESLGRSLQRTARTRWVSAPFHIHGVGSTHKGQGGISVLLLLPQHLLALYQLWVIVVQCGASHCHRFTSREKRMAETTGLWDCSTSMLSAPEAALKWAIFSNWEHTHLQVPCRDGELLFEPHPRTIQSLMKR